MKTHRAWIRVTAAAVIVAGAAAEPASAQFAPYRPATPQPVAGVQNSYTPYTAYRTQAAYPTTATPTGANYAQPTSAYPQTAAPYPSTAYGTNPYLALQTSSSPAAVGTLPAPQKHESGPQPATSAAPNGAGPAEAIPNGQSAMTSGSTAYGAGAAACGCNGGSSCNGGSYPDYGISNYFGNDGCDENQWFGGIYFLEMGRTNSTAVKLTTEIPTGTVYPYYPPSSTTVLDSRDADYNFREGVEFRLGSTFSVGGPCSSCQTGCNSYGYGYNGCNSCNSCNSCSPATTYAWEVAWWGLNYQPEADTAVYNGTNRLVGMKNFVGVQYDFNGGGAVAVNNFYGYELPVLAGPPPYQILAQRVRTDFKAQDLELNLFRFPVCNTCTTGCGGCNSACAGGSSCNTGGCDDGCGCGIGFSMYGSCGVRYFRVDDNFMYADEFGDGVHTTYDGFTYDNPYELAYNVDVENNLIGPQVGWTTDYCIGRWDLFCNSTFGIFNNHMNVWQRLWSGGGDAVTLGDGSTFNVRSNKDAVAFLGELRVGTAYTFSCHWRGIIAYRAVAITGLATATTQLDNDYMDRATVAIIDSDNSVIIHGVQVGAECRY